MSTPVTKKLVDAAQEVLTRSMWDENCDCAKCKAMRALEVAIILERERGSPEPLPCGLFPAGNPRFSIQLDGKFIFDDDDDYDAKLKLDGNWPDSTHRVAYAQAVCEALNKGAIPVGTPPLRETIVTRLPPDPTGPGPVNLGVYQTAGVAMGPSNAPIPSDVFRFPPLHEPAGDRFTLNPAPGWNTLRIEGSLETHTVDGVPHAGAAENCPVCPPLREEGPAALVGALQDVVHTDTGAVRAGRSVREEGAELDDPKASRDALRYRWLRERLQVRDLEMMSGAFARCIDVKIGCQRLDQPTNPRHVSVGDTDTLDAAIDIAMHGMKSGA